MSRRRPADAADALARVRIVLVRPRGAANVGAVARAMMNCGIGDLVLVRPAFRSRAAAERMAVHARDLLRAAPVVDDLAVAVADCTVVVGTTCRRGGYRTAAGDLEAAAPELHAVASSGRLAVVFGPEDHGLANDDLRHCQRLISIDTHPDYASLNLAQAVLLVCYALRRAATAGAVEAAAPALADAAPAGMLDGLYAHLQAALLHIGFLNPQNPEHLMFALRGLIGRAAPTAHEVKILRGMARQIDWAARTFPLPQGEGQGEGMDQLASSNIPAARGTVPSRSRGALVEASSSSPHPDPLPAGEGAFSHRSRS